MTYVVSDGRVYALTTRRAVTGGAPVMLSVPCGWFVTCENLATHLEPHTVLGEVPCCDRCAEIGK